MPVMAIVSFIAQDGKPGLFLSGLVVILPWTIASRSSVLTVMEPPVSCVTLGLVWWCSHIELPLWCARNPIMGVIGFYLQFWGHLLVNFGRFSQ